MITRIGNALCEQPSGYVILMSAFSTRFREYGLNHYDMFVPDLLHEFELGVWILRKRE